MPVRNELFLKLFIQLIRMPDGMAGVDAAQQEYTVVLNI